MAILIWLSIFTVSFFGFQVFLRALKGLVSQRALAKYKQAPFVNQFLAAKLATFAAIDVDQAFHNAIEMEKDQSISQRIYQVLMSLIFVSQFLVLFLLATVAFKFSGAFVGLVGILLWILSRFLPRFEGRSYIFLGWAIFALGMEQVLRQGALLMNAVNDHPWILTLGNSSLSGSLVLMLVAFVLTFLIRLPFLGLLIGQALVVSGIMSLPSAMALVFGENLYWLYSMVLNKNLSQSVRGPLFYKRWISTIVIAAFVFLFPLYQGFLEIIWGGEYSPLLRFEQLLITVALWTMVDTAISSGFFHFYFEKTKSA